MRERCHVLSLLPWFARCNSAILRLIGRFAPACARGWVCKADQYKTWSGLVKTCHPSAGRDGSLREACGVSSPAGLISLTPSGRGEGEELWAGGGGGDELLEDFCCFALLGRRHTFCLACLLVPAVTICACALSGLSDHPCSSSGRLSQSA